MTSIRETKEEVGMDLRSHSVHIGTLDDRTSPLQEGLNSLVIRPYVFHAGSGNDWMCEPNEEVSEILVQPEGVVGPSAPWKHVVRVARAVDTIAHHSHRRRRYMGPQFADVG